MKQINIYAGVVVALIGLMAFGTGCPSMQVDRDRTCDLALPLPVGVDFPDKLNVPRGDKADCKWIRPRRDAVAIIKYKIGSRFRSPHHTLFGNISIRDELGNVLHTMAVESSQVHYPFKFAVKGKSKYYATLLAIRGRSDYTVTLNYGPPDPCALCTQQEVCVSKKCVPKDKVCIPGCNEKTQICRNGKCVTPCDPPCRRRFTCDARAESPKCVPKNKCYRCPRTCRGSEYCNKRSCRCKKKRPSCRTCDRGCLSGTRCRSGCCRKISTCRKCSQGCRQGTRCRSGCCVKIR